jgi:sigma-B regulation protein RsbU (phosphoserine phosphatase)
MVLFETQLTANEVLRAFHHDEPYLILGAAFTTVAVISIGICVIRRRFDPMLVWLAIFAHLYGQRLWLNAEILGLTLPDSEWFHRFRAVVNLLVPVPGFIFFYVAGLLGNGGKRIATACSVVFLFMAAGTLILGPLRAFDVLNAAIVIGVFWILIARSLGNKSKDHDFAVVRAGVLCFGFLALWDNIVAKHWLPYSIEPYGFAILLACLGYVAARRTLARDLKLGEIQNELELARRIQFSILPKAFPPSNAFRVAARYVPMTSVAGDLYDFLIADDLHAGLLIADVSGHGVPAALIASMVKMAATSQRANADHPAQLMAGMNAALCGNTQGQFVTAAYVYLDASRRELRYAAAGHPAMLILRGGAVREISENGLLLAAVEHAAYSERILVLEAGDRLLLYTDGLTEARNGQGSLFGEQALAAMLLDSGLLSPDDAADRIIAAVQQWAKSQDDDLTLLICDFAGAQ